MNKKQRKKDAKIIAAFGCLGKTRLSKKHPDLVLDLESSIFEYDHIFDIREIEKIKGSTNRRKNPSFPHNYIKEIKKNIDKYKMILIVPAKEVLRELDSAGIKYTIIYPKLTRKQRMLEDAKKRGNGQRFIDKLDNILSSKEDMLYLKNNLNYDSFILIDDDKYLSDMMESKYDWLRNDKMQEPIIQSGFIHKDKKYFIDFFKIEGNKLPNYQWDQVYIIGNYKNMVPIVNYTSSRSNLPGGGVKSNENISQAIERELREEINMTNKRWLPIGYQRVYDSSGNEEYQLRVYADLDICGSFEGDIDGSVIGYELTDIDDLNHKIGYGEVGDYLVARLRTSYGKKA